MTQLCCRSFCTANISLGVSPLKVLMFVQVSPKEVDNPSVSAIREAREEAGVIGNEKRERGQKTMSEGGGEGSPSLLVRCQTQLKEREGGEGVEYGSYQILAPAGIAIL